MAIDVCAIERSSANLNDADDIAPLTLGAARFTPPYELLQDDILRRTDRNPANLEIDEHSAVELAARQRIVPGAKHVNLDHRCLMNRIERAARGHRPPH